MRLVVRWPVPTNLTTDEMKAKVFATAIETGNVDGAREAILSRFPDHRVLQFLDEFSLPAYLPSAANG